MKRIWLKVNYIFHPQVFDMQKKQKCECNEMGTAGPNILILSKPEMLVIIISLFLHKCLKDVRIYSKYIAEVQIHCNQKE